MLVSQYHKYGPQQRQKDQEYGYELFTWDTSTNGSIEGNNTEH